MSERMASLETKVEQIQIDLKEIKATLSELSRARNRYDGAAWAIARICAVTVSGISLIAALAAILDWMANNHLQIIVK